jgi:hypothetical protein
MIEVEIFYTKVFLKVEQVIGNSIGAMERFQKKESTKLGEKMEFGKNIEKMEVWIL